MSGGFLEPLESTGIILIEAAAYMIAAFTSATADLAPAAARFNRLMTARYERIVDFIKLHYFLTQRTDTAFWRDNAQPVERDGIAAGAPGNVAPSPAGPLRSHHGP